MEVNLETRLVLMQDDDDDDDGWSHCDVSTCLAFCCCFNAVVILIYRSQPRVAIRGTAAFGTYIFSTLN